MTKFSKFGLAPEILRAIEKQGFDECTTVQQKTIPALLQQKDIIAKAPTGTGKTIAFAAPILQLLDREETRVQALILCPTRELALQINDEIRKLSIFLQGVRSITIYGKRSMERQIAELKGRPQIVVATPGRLGDHIRRRTIDLSGVRTVVLDEADRMLDMGFIKDVCRILDRTSNRRNLAMMSATLSVEVQNVAWEYQRDAVEVEVAEVLQDKPQIEQYCVDVSGSKVGDMTAIIDEKGYGRVIVFCNTKQMASQLAQRLIRMGRNADCIHGDVQQVVREKVMKRFKEGQLSILIATDVAARGIDVDDVDAVFNYDLPNENEYYTHRIGRTGRAQKSGVSYSFITHFDIQRLREIERYTQTQMIPLRFNAEHRLVPKEQN